MNTRNLIPALLLTCVIIAIFTSGSGCANMIPPSGGPRDSLPPVLISVSPGDSTRNFSGNRIVFNFNEYIDIQNVTENLLVSPLPQNIPAVDFKLRTMTVRLRDTLEANTTYTLNFGEAVKDFTEGNIAKGFTYTFSTGNYIDSLTFSGKVILAETGGIDTTLIVMLHTDGTDSSVVKKKPRYITKLDSEGNFTFRNLPPRTFYLYALKDEGGTRRYFGDEQLFAFADTAINIRQATPAVTLYAYNKPAPPKPAAAPAPPGRPRKNEPNTVPRLRYEANLTNGSQDLLRSLTLTFDDSLRNYDSSKISLYIDSAFKPATGYRFVKDSTGRKIELITTWQENTLYNVIIDKDFANGVNNLKLLRTDTLTFTTLKRSDYGVLKLRLRNLDISKNPVLQFVQNGVIYKSYPLSGVDFTQPLFIPGEFDLRILYDDNKNGVWDPGQFFGTRRQPEIVKPVERKIVVKANWQNEFEIVL